MIKMTVFKYQTDLQYMGISGDNFALFQKN